MPTVLVGGRDGGRARGRCDFELIVPSQNTARIQEVHTVVLHTWLDRVDEAFGLAPRTRPDRPRECGTKPCFLIVTAR